MRKRSDIKPKPFLKWAGGKKALLPQILKYIPETYNKYYEPFLGSGVLFFALKPKEAYLSDLNKELINTYKQIKFHVNDVKKELKIMKYSKKFYYRIRKQNLRSASSRAARFIYLNKTCWNGLYRDNKKGEFNVPIGRYKNPLIYDEDNLKRVKTTLKKAKILNVDFEIALKTAAKNDLIYLDPPYVTGHKDNGFIEYNSKIFSLEDQERLHDVVCKLDKKGCKIIVSNSDHSFIRELYSEFNINVIKRKSLIAGNIKNRKTVTELGITNF